MFIFIFSTFQHCWKTLFLRFVYLPCSMCQCSNSHKYNPIQRQSIYVIWFYHCMLCIENEVSSICGSFSETFKNIMTHYRLWRKNVCGKFKSHFITLNILKCNYIYNIVAYCKPIIVEFNWTYFIDHLQRHTKEIDP